MSVTVIRSAEGVDPMKGLEFIESVAYCKECHAESPLPDEESVLWVELSDRARDVRAGVAYCPFTCSGCGHNESRYSISVRASKWATSGPVDVNAEERLKFSFGPYPGPSFVATYKGKDVTEMFDVIDFKYHVNARAHRGRIVPVQIQVLAHVEIEAPAVLERCFDKASPVDALQVKQEELIKAAAARILAAGYANEEDDEAVRNAAIELLDAKSIHDGDIGSIAAHYNLYT